jgi:phospholipid/cholesterol/gamma-HCH transport system substrate-binding protein
LRTQTVWWRRGIAGILGVLCTAALVAVGLLATSAGGSNGGYTVRAIFDDAGNIISGEDVKIDGVKVGTVGSVVPTVQSKAAVTLKIVNPGFQDFRTDATCAIKPQALIGEKYVDCLPTQPRAVGTPEKKALAKVPAGEEGAGERLLPVTNTSSPVDVDLLGDITRLPERQRLTIIINELGAGLAGRGSDLNAVVRRADPALRETDKFLAILANEKKVLVKLADDSDKALAPFAAVRNRVADFIVKSNIVAKATAEHRGALARNLADFPPFLRQFGPALERLGRFADETTPVFTDLGIAAPGINNTFTHLGPFAKSSQAFFQNFGKTSQTSGPALVASKSLLGHLQTLGGSAKPFAGNLSGLFSSLRETGGLERLLDFVFLGVGVTNGYDSLGHFLRAEVAAPPCVTYAIAPAAACNSKFLPAERSATSAKTTAVGDPATTSLVMERTLAVLKGETPAQAIAKYPGSISTGKPSDTGAATATAKPVGGASAGTTYYTPSAEESGVSGLLLNYLLGN